MKDPKKKKVTGYELQGLVNMDLHPLSVLTSPKRSVLPSPDAPRRPGGGDLDAGSRRLRNAWDGDFQEVQLWFGLEN
jgi:hypothetical protein